MKRPITQRRLRLNRPSTTTRAPLRVLRPSSARPRACRPASANR
ncbi:MAG: hypothetical protein QGH76_01745 [Phycisphaerales bacterium]|jgi:hypothetical protein|nr:hypothetical protein [Phycisphaerales bacterium]